jgi:hypothetical protein
VLDPVEGAAVAEQFGVAAAQVRRDHLISHLLAALSLSLANELVFFRGTALARSLVPDGRLSEDIDLLAIGRRRDVVGAVERQLVQGVRRDIPVFGRDHGAGPAVGSDRRGAVAGGIAGAGPAVLRCATGAAAGTHCGIVRGVEDGCVAGPCRRS